MDEKRDKDSVNALDGSNMAETNMKVNKKTKKTRLTESLRENLKKRKVQARKRSTAKKLSSNVYFKKE